MTKKSSSKKIIEESCREILIKVFNKNPEQENTFNKFFMLIFVGSSVFLSYFYLKLNIKTEFIVNFLELLTTVYSIIIGFAFTSLGLFLSIFDKDFIVFINLKPSKLYKDSSLYKTTVLVFFEYLFALLISLIYILICYFLIPFLNNFLILKTCFVYIFFILLFALLGWTFISIKGMVYNIYMLTVFKAEYFKKEMELKKTSRK